MGQVTTYVGFLSAWSRSKGQRIRSGVRKSWRRAVAWFGRARTWARLFILKLWYTRRVEGVWFLRALALVAVAILLKRYWIALDGYLFNIERSVVPELAIGIGAAISGIIAIAFTLSLFAVQQIADKATPSTVQAYARDPILAFVYWALASLAIASFVVGLLKTDHFYRTVAAVTVLICLFSSFVLLNFHFRRVLRFSDPSYTVLRLFQEGEKQLRRLQVLRDSIRPAQANSSSQGDD